jgi:ribokinase
MKVLNFGSLNIDYVYDVGRFVRASETIAAMDRHIFCGGKGLNQSIAMAKAGVPVYHAGCVGEGGDILVSALTEAGVDAGYVLRTEGPVGHTVIQVDKDGQNCIIVYGGTNRRIPREHIDRVLADFTAGDLLVLQNEINDLAYIMGCATGKGMEIVFNPSPCDARVMDYPQIGRAHV